MEAHITKAVGRRLMPTGFFAGTVGNGGMRTAVDKNIQSLVVIVLE